MTANARVRVLIVDDDCGLVSLLSEFLTAAGIQVETASDGSKGLAMAVDGAPDLVILDVMLPVLDGFGVLRHLRKRSNVPVIMLTARGERGDRIAGLETGADDYVAKPFDPDELLARVNAILRRTGKLGAAQTEPVIAGTLTVDALRRVVMHEGGEVPLTAIEFEIVDLLARPAGRMVSRDEISTALYQRPAGAFDRSIDVHMSRIRRKLESTGMRIQSVRGTGYVLTPGSAAPEDSAS